MKKGPFSLSLFLLTLMLCFLCPVHSRADSGYAWVLDEETLQLQYIDQETQEPVKSQFMDITGYTYYFNKNGYAATGFTKIDGFYYFFRSDGSMVKSQWHANRYFTKNGKMAVNQYVKDGSTRKYVGSDGIWIPNYKKSRKAKFVKTKKGTKYRNYDGTYSASTWQCINGKWYYFYSTGYMAKSTKLGKFYVNKKGQMVTNKWVKIGSYKYYYGADGRLVKKVRYKKKTTSTKVVNIN